MPVIDKQELDEIARRYHANADVPDKHIEDLCQRFCTNWILSTLIPGTRILELGFGEGIVTQALVEAGMNVTVIEGSQILHDQIRAEYDSRVIAVHALFEEYTTDATFDVVLASHVLEHVEDPVGLLRRIKPWLTPNGRLIVIVPNRESLHRRLAVFMGLQTELDTLSQRDHLVGHRRVYSHESLARDLLDGGFRTTGATGFFLKSLPNSMMLEYSEALLWAMNQIAPQLPKELLANIGVIAVPIQS